MKRKFEMSCRDVLSGTKGATEAEILEQEKEEEEREKRRLEEEVSQLLHKRAIDAGAQDTTVRK